MCADDGPDVLNDRSRCSQTHGLHAHLGDSPHGSRMCRAFDVHVIPYGAVGGLLSSEGDGAADSRAPVLHGQAFCSLPVTPTGLPVHVNGELLFLP